MKSKNKKLSAQDGKFIYEGDIVTDDKSKQMLYDGQGYLFNTETKCFFKGTWKRGEKVCGIETFPNGDVYEGQYKDGVFHGRGLIYNNVQLYPDKKGQYLYDGQFEQGQKHGFGKEQYFTGGRYEGQFKCNQKHGPGKLVFSDGSYFVGDFQRGLPNGFGVHVAYSKDRIVSTFPPPSNIQERLESEAREEIQEQEQEKEKSEYLYEGEFVDGYKHGLGRLYYPSGSYFYAYWEYNKPARDFIEYIAEGHKWRILNVKQLQTDQSINFFKIIRDNKSSWIEKYPIKGNSYPPAELDGYKVLIDEKGLKREDFEDPEFDYSEQSFSIKDENDQPVVAPIEFERIFASKYFKKKEFKLFTKDIQPGYLQYSEQYCCQQLTVVLNALTFHSYLLNKVFTRKYEAEIGFYFIKLFLKNEWKEYIIDDKIPVFKYDKMPIFSNSQEPELAWVILFKAFAKYNQSFQYFTNDKLTRAVEYLTLLTGMPTVQFSIPNNFGENQEYSDQQKKIWKTMSQKYQSTKVRICYLYKEMEERLKLPRNTAYQIVDMQESSLGKRDESYFLLILASHQKLSLKQDITNQTSQARYKLQERNPQARGNEAYFLMEYKDFIKHFQYVIMLCATRYPIQNQQLIEPEEKDKHNQELRFFCRFRTNLTQDCLICVTQDHQDKQEEYVVQEKTFPVRIVLAKEKDLFTNKNQVKKKIVSRWTEQVSLSKQERDKDKKEDTTKAEMKYTSLFDQNADKKQINPYKYCFGKGQSSGKMLFKDASLESGAYVLFVQVETGDSKEQFDLKKMKFWITIHSQKLIQIQRLDQQILDFQKLVYESAIAIADKHSQDTNKFKYFHKGDLSEQENGSSDLVITQYFIKKEGTYLQHLHNKSSNKIWRQKLYFKLDNMQIIDHRESQKLDICLSKKQTALIIIQQVGAKKYNLEGGEGICIVDLLHDELAEEEQEVKNNETATFQEDNQQIFQQTTSKPKFGSLFFKS
ncbi:unnamed protein product (macronuclear) [Paramecium tetraurelia]|uniref:Calpain catalytic domain-containing protein n=1 Tax=Paramecium tetraurelia TaxID=5888 RepID=A0E0J2_PARTE|nr:uncharacterized protein GSPATT00021977001 [Paramecium tetraurelia]CAK88809.1 unnamed protein product [Paramecium tetraurelia]|eukprot:XP_001456206.1 hypothetical protein (macronuclear) [Paramecium tetraurelia strain d4-2]